MIRLPELEPATEALPVLPQAPLSAFADSLEPDRGPIRLCVVAQTIDARLQLDFRDSDALLDDPFVLTPDQAMVAAAAAVADALEAPRRSAAWAEHLRLRTEGTRLGSPSSAADVTATAMLMARVYDVVAGALSQAWPQRVGAGSCSLGAIVSIDGDEEVIGGGEGGRPDRAGRSEWPGPILDARPFTNVRGVEIESRVREGSGGGGARSGGDGQVRVYKFREPKTVRIAIDRRRNPPHGIDRAGPPEPARAMLNRDGGPQAAPVFRDLAVRAGETLTVETAGGAGHGFAGYGDIEWDPKEWF